MKRREFNSRMAGVFGAVLYGRSFAEDAQRSIPTINGERMLSRLQALAEIGRMPSGGSNRVAFSQEDRDGRQLVTELMRSAKLEVNVDTAGNIIGKREGSDVELPPIMVGSHIDSVPDGGHYDGPLGSLGAIEVTQTLDEYGITTRHPIEAVVFQNEEGGKTGSRAMVGRVAKQELDLQTHSGRTIREGIKFIGGDPDRLDAALRRQGEVAAFLELHIEQGAVLENAAVTIGVVEGIVGIKRWRVEAEGIANHAGTTPMDARHDALLTAARFVDMVNRVVTGVPGTHVGTIGEIEVHPGAPNVVPGRATLSLEIRDLSMEVIDRLFDTIATEGLALGSKNGTSLTLEQIYESEAAPTDESIRAAIAQAAGELGLAHMLMPSGAGHDAQSLALIAPVGMVFIPSEGGLSHASGEYSKPEDVVAGTNVLLGSLLHLDRAI